MYHTHTCTCTLHDKYARIHESSMTSIYFVTAIASTENTRFRVPARVILGNLAQRNHQRANFRFLICKLRDCNVEQIQSKGLLARTKNCPSCNHAMEMQGRNDINDKYRCTKINRLNTGCRKSCLCEGGGAQ